MLDEGRLVGLSPSTDPLGRAPRRVPSCLDCGPDRTRVGSAGTDQIDSSRSNRTLAASLLYPITTFSALERGKVSLILSLGGRKAVRKNART